MDYFPPSESRKRFMISQAVILGLIMLVIGVVASIFWLKYFLTQASDIRHVRCRARQEVAP